MKFWVPSLPHCKMRWGTRSLQSHLFFHMCWRGIFGLTITRKLQPKTSYSLAMFVSNALLVSISTCFSDETTGRKESEVAFHSIPNALLKWYMSIDSTDWLSTSSWGICVRTAGSLDVQFLSTSPPSLKSSCISAQSLMASSTLSAPSHHCHHNMNPRQLGCGKDTSSNDPKHSASLPYSWQKEKPKNQM